MTDYTNRIRRAAVWIDRETDDIPVPALHTSTAFHPPRITLSWHVNTEPLPTQVAVLDAVRGALGDVPWDVKTQGSLTWVTTEVDGLAFNVYVAAKSVAGFTPDELAERMTS